VQVEQSLEYLRDQKQFTPPIESPAQKIVTPPIQETRESDIQLTVPPVEVTDLKTKERLVKQKELSEHRYMQMFIKKMAEARGYKAEIEAPTPDGTGLVDVSLERSGKKIACEIGMTTTKEWEVHNIEKCLAAGYDKIVAIAKNKEAVKPMQEVVTKRIDTTLIDRVLVMDSDSFIQYLSTEIAKEANTETRTKGYRVIVEYDTTISEQDMIKKKEKISKAVIDSIKKKD
jgi:hypothetical protein